jgi:hypothetical protein
MLFGFGVKVRDQEPNDFLHCWRHLLQPWIKAAAGRYGSLTKIQAVELAMTALQVAFR